MRRDVSASRYRRLLVLVTVVTGLVITTWALLAPAFRAPDEPVHVNSVVRLMSGGGWPPPGEARLVEGVNDALGQARYWGRLPGRETGWGDTQFEDLEPVPDDERVGIDVTDPAQMVRTEVNDQMTQHPPLYYAIVAGLLRGFDDDSTRWDVQLLLMRLASVLMTVPVVPLLAETTRLLTSSRSLALAASTVPLFIPQFQHISGSVTNDALLSLTGAATTYLTVRTVGGDLRWGVALLAGAALGAGLLTKAFMLLAIPMVLLAFLLARSTTVSFVGRAGRAAAAAAAAFAVGGWWWARNLILYGAIQPSGHQTPVSGSAAPRTLEIFLDRAWGYLTQSFWGRFSWLELEIDSRYVVGATTIALTLATIGLVTSGRRFREAILMASFAGSLILLVAYQGFRAYQRTGLFPGLQGRYFFVALGALTGLAALGVFFVARRSERVLAVLTPVVTVVGLCVTAMGLWVGFVGFYRGDGDSVWTAASFWVDASPATAAQTIGVLSALVIASVALVIWMITSTAQVLGRSEPETPTGPDPIAEEAR